MKEEIFRKKSLDKMKSPESLNDYVRVTNPGIWLLLIAIIALLVGFLAWSIFGNMEGIVEGEAYVEDGIVTCYVDLDSGSYVEEGMLIRVKGKEGTITEVKQKDLQGYACSVEMKAPISDGAYSAEIVTERIKPISFVVN